jgi:hypothetical protein
MSVSTSIYNAGPSKYVDNPFEDIVILHGANRIGLEQVSNYIVHAWAVAGRASVMVFGSGSVQFPV